MKHDYSITGHVNGRHIQGRGTGAIDPSTGVSEMDVTFERIADGWDPRSIVLMCCDRALIMAAREELGAVGMFRASGGELTIGGHLPGNGREGVMRTGRGELMAHVNATSRTDLRGDAPFDHSRVEGGFSHLKQGLNGIKRIPPFDGVMFQAGPNLVVVTTRFVAELEDGSTIFGSTNYPHYLPDQVIEIPGHQQLRVESVEQRLDGSHLYSKVTTSVMPLIAQPQEPVSQLTEPLMARA
ncbi:hypothetical protein J4H86_19995 [Spiractinospora alimapuensis]|uniref:hypothetical protein n=1 Tax=Spiractinospora alimapuensis TaxID=2820884 RepID=UPI001F2C4A55|nr:hypothetical protein [Spiractinospora alimapuensis]QVQ51096.1 hypothetical protein J4H86_19995 [Spiractinospora alimapuensis]